jgi:hypothetical protein
MDDAEVMVIKKKQLEEQLVHFPKIRDFMVNIADEKKRYHNVLIKESINCYSQNDVYCYEKLGIKSRQFTTHMSLKRQLKKQKQRKL